MAKIVKKEVRKKRNPENLYDYKFWCDSIKEGGKLWYAIPRDQEILFFNGRRKEAQGVISNKSITALEKEIELL